MEKKDMFYNQWWFWAISFASLIIVVSVAFYSGDDQTGSFASNENNAEVEFNEDASETFPRYVDFNNDVLNSGLTYNEVMDNFLNHLESQIDEDDLFLFGYDSNGTIFIEINEGESKIYDMIASHEEGTYNAPDEFFDLLEKTVLAVLVETERHIGENLKAILRVEQESKIRARDHTITDNSFRR